MLYVFKIQSSLESRMSGVGQFYNQHLKKENSRKIKYQRDCRAAMGGGGAGTFLLEPKWQGREKEVVSLLLAYTLVYTVPIPSTVQIRELI